MGLTVGLAPCSDYVAALLPLATKLNDTQLKAQLGVIDCFVSSVQAAVPFAKAFDGLRNQTVSSISRFDTTFFQQQAACLRQMTM